MVPAPIRLVPLLVESGVESDLDFELNMDRILGLSKMVYSLVVSTCGMASKVVSSTTFPSPVSAFLIPSR